jgi:hypothetical protein
VRRIDQARTHPAEVSWLSLGPEKKRWQIYRPQIVDGLKLCGEAGLSDDKEFIELLPRINVLDDEWTVACELRQAMAAQQPPSPAPILPGNLESEDAFASMIRSVEQARAEDELRQKIELRTDINEVVSSVSWKEAAASVGQAKYGADWIELTERERWLIGERKPGEYGYRLLNAAEKEEIDRSNDRFRRKVSQEDYVYEWLRQNGFAPPRVNRLSLEEKLNRDSRIERTAAGDRVVLLPPCTVKTEGYVSLSQAVYWKVPKESINSMAGIKLRDWEAGYSDLVSWIEAKKVTLFGRRPGEGLNEVISAEILANHPIVDWTFDTFGELDGARRHLTEPWPDSPFLRCCYCPDFEHWQRAFNDQIFDAKHKVQWTHLQVDMAEVVAASKTTTSQREPLSAVPSEVATINLPIRYGCASFGRRSKPRAAKPTRTNSAGSSWTSLAPRAWWP